MDKLTGSNIALFVAAVGGITTAFKLAEASNFIGAVIAGVIGLGAIWLYEKLPPSPPIIP